MRENVAGRLPRAVSSIASMDTSSTPDTTAEPTDASGRFDAGWRPTIALLALAVIAFVAYLTLPPLRGAESIRVAAPAISAAVIFGLAIRVRPRGLAGWYWLGTSMTFLVVAHAFDVSDFFDLTGDPESLALPGRSDWFHLAAAIALLLAGLARARLRRATEYEFGALEVVIISIAVGVGIWLALVEPYLAGDAEGLEGTLVVSLVPAVGALTFAASFRLAAHSGFRRMAPVLAVIAAGMQASVDLLRGSLERQGDYGPGGVAAALCVVPPLLFAAAGVHSVSHPADESAPTVNASGPRTVGISLAVLTPVTVLFVLAVGGLATTATRVTVAIAAVVAVVLALIRMWRLLDSVRKLSERRGQDRLAAMVEHSSDIVLLTDHEGIIRYASPGLSTTLGYERDDWVGRPVLDLVADHARANAAQHLAGVTELGPNSTVRFESVLVRIDEQRRQVETTAANLLGGDDVDGIVMTMRDVTEQRALERRLSRRAHYDELTGLANRALFLDRVDHALRTARPDADPVVVLFVDLDDFKAVNDVLGHAVGDQMLVAISQQIRDVVGSGDTPARLGGDEFAVLLADRGGVERAIAVAEELLGRLTQPLGVAGYRLTVNASVGVGVAAPDMTTSDLLRDADTAMYEAKRAGKGQVKIFDPAMQVRSSGHMASQVELERAFHEGQLRVVYQPFVALSTGQVLGAQAALRWSHPERGDVPIDEFLPVAETTGLVVPIGRWLLNETAREAARWQAAGPLSVGVRVPLGLLRSSGFVDDVAAALATSGLDPRRLALGIPGDAVVETLDGAQSILSRIRELGALVSVSDFGSGELSLVDLRRAEVDALRIDPHFVEELDGDGSSVGRVILETCATLGIASVAVGIRRPSQLATLRRLGATVGQGPLICGPLEVDEIRRRFGLADGPGATGTGVGGHVGPSGRAYAAADG